MDPLTIALVAVGAVFVVVILLRMRGLVASVRLLIESLQQLGARPRRPPGPELPVDERFRDVGDEPRDGRPDPYG